MIDFLSERILVSAVASAQAAGVATHHRKEKGERTLSALFSHQELGAHGDGGRNAPGLVERSLRPLRGSASPCIAARRSRGAGWVGRARTATSRRLLVVS